jgi:hypothetical protein
MVGVRSAVDGQTMPPAVARPLPLRRRKDRLHYCVVTGVDDGNHSAEGDRVCERCILGRLVAFVLGSELDKAVESGFNGDLKQGFLPRGRRFQRLALSDPFLYVLQPSGTT